MVAMLQIRQPSRPPERRGNVDGRCAMLWYITANLISLGCRSTSFGGVVFRGVVVIGGVIAQPTGNRGLHDDLCVLYDDILGDGLLMFGAGVILDSPLDSTFSEAIIPMPGVSLMASKNSATAAFVLIDTAKYHEKLDAILSDESKFERLTRNPKDDIKREANGVISAVNAATNAVHFPPIQGDYSLGYLYDNVKTLKQGNSLRPIISQTPDPTYALAKCLNQILTHYITSRYSLQSSAEFLEAIKDAPGTGIIASLDLESLFANVPVDETIDIILDCVYRNQSTAPINVPEALLRMLLEICTTKAPFSTHRGQMFRQMDGMVMGSPLGVLFANIYMGTVEERVFARMQQPCSYGCYIDDIFVQVDAEDEVEAFCQAFQQCSVLNYTVEHSSDNRLPFLDVLVSKTEDGLRTSIYTNKTNLGLCLNGDSECPARFKSTSVRALVRRALSHCSTWQDTHQELDRISQNRRTRDLIMKNNPSSRVRDPLKQTHVVYQYTCPVRECSGAYIGMTTMRLSKRLLCHAQEVAIKNHACTKHQEAISQDVIILNMKIIA
ncbi:uncharacterized protein LOC135215952 [Macrobrachium nipponense]|uniref:uncharacterized protein LOC135215952 n=1 Tax=Macrobrachium nipponense TaxID=159736 RepID=UPI0030C7F102